MTARRTLLAEKHAGVVWGVFPDFVKPAAPERADGRPPEGGEGESVHKTTDSATENP